MRLCWTVSAMKINVSRLHTASDALYSQLLWAGKKGNGKRKETKTKHSLEKYNNAALWEIM